jgi:hypothetical protein
VSGHIPPTSTDPSQLAFFWRFDGETGCLRVAQAVAGLPDLLLFLPAGIDPMELAHLVSKYYSHFLNSHCR